MSVASSIYEYWARPVDAWRASLFRMAVALIATLDLLITRLPMTEKYYTLRGVFAPEHMQQMRDFMWTWSLLPLDASESYVWWFILLTSLCGVMAVAGALTRLSTIALFLGYTSVQFMNSSVMNGGDFTLGVALFLLCLMPSEKCWSVDAWVMRKIGRPFSPQIEPWSIRLAQIQLCFIYTFTALLKLAPVSWYVLTDYSNIGDWASGRALGESLTDPMINRFPWPGQLAWWVYAPANWATIIWELFFPLLILYKRTRKLALLFGLMLHVGILVLMEIAHFSFSISAFYLLFWPKEWLPARLRRLVENDGDTPRGNA